MGNGTGYNQAVLQGGLVGEAAGFQIHLSNNVPNTSGTKYKIIAGHQRRRAPTPSSWWSWRRTGWRRISPTR